MNYKTRVATVAALSVASVAIGCNVANADTARPATGNATAAQSYSASVAHARPVAQRIAAPRPVAGDDTSSDLQQAITAGEEQAGMATGLGTIIGTVIGVAVGCPLGAVTAGSLTTLATAGTLTVPLAIAGCLVGSSAVGGAGAMAGGMVLAIPVGLAAGVQTFNSLQAAHHHPAPQPAH